jgi:hypothetical protein
MNDGGGDRSETVAALPQIIADLRAKGYTFVTISGSAGTEGPASSAVYGFAQAPTELSPVVSKLPLVGMTIAPLGSGYSLVAQVGGIFSFGDAAFFGSRGGQGGTDRFFVSGVAHSGLGYLLAGQHPDSELTSSGPLHHQRHGPHTRPPGCTSQRATAADAVLNVVEAAGSAVPSCGGLDPLLRGRRNFQPGE